MRQNLDLKQSLKILLALLPAVIPANCVQEPKGPDYVITDFQYSNAPQSIAATGVVSFKVKNTGTENGNSAVNVNLYISPYRYYDQTAATLMATPPVSVTLSPPEKNQTSATQSISYTIPAGATKTSYFILKIDTADKEIDTFNNITSSAVISVPNGIILRTLLVANTPGSTFNIGGFDTQYFRFATTINHAYQIFWDDYSEGTLFQSPTAANVKISSATSDNLTTFFSQLDTGFNTPQTVFSANGVDIHIDVATTGTGGQYSLRLLDIGTPPNLSIQLASPTYSTGQSKLTFNYTIQNTSTIAIAGATFTVGFWVNTVSPTISTPTDLSLLLSNTSIPGGGSITGSVSIITLNASGTASATAYVDILNNIIENNENDNLSAGLPW